MNYSIIVPTCNRQKDLDALINSILKQTLLPAEIIIIDQSDNDDTKKYIENCRKQLVTGAHKTEVIYIYQAKKSLVVARNKGIDAAMGQIVSFLDDDVVLFEDYYEKILCCFINDEKIGGVSGNIIPENKLYDWKTKLRKILYRVFLIDNFNGKMTVSGFGFPRHGFENKKEISIQAEMLSGCNMNFRKKFLKNDKYDEWFTGYSFREDAELSYRISRKTILKMIPEAKLYHNNSRSNRMDIRALKTMEIKNYYYFFKKHAKKTIISNILFFYSMSGLWIIYCIEFFCNCNKEKYNQLKGFSAGIISLFKTKNNH